MWIHNFEKRLLTSLDKPIESISQTESVNTCIRNLLPAEYDNLYSFRNTYIDFVVRYSHNEVVNSVGNTET